MNRHGPHATDPRQPGALQSGRPHGRGTASEDDEGPSDLDRRPPATQQYEGFAPTPDFVIDVVEDGYGFLNADKFKAGFAADASDAEAAFLRDSQVPINMAVFTTPVKNAAWRDKPSWAVIATRDKSFDQAMAAIRFGWTFHEQRTVRPRRPKGPPAPKGFR